jgi:hypothetical protein
MRRGIGRYLVLAAVAAASVGWTAQHWPPTPQAPAMACALAGLGACLLSILQTVSLMTRFDHWMAERLPGSFIAEITGGSPPTGASPDTHYEAHRTGADRAETIRILAREERHRR